MKKSIGGSLICIWQFVEWKVPRESGFWGCCTQGAWVSPREEVPGSEILLVRKGSGEVVCEFVGRTKCIKTLCEFGHGGHRWY